jgi:hypothetical protein
MRDSLINVLHIRNQHLQYIFTYWQGCKTNIAFPRYGAMTADGNQVDRYEAINNHYGAAEFDVSRWNLCPWK